MAIGIAQSGQKRDFKAAWCSGEQKAVVWVDIGEEG